MKTDKNDLIKNSLFNSIYKVMNIFFPIITASYASHIILSSGIGKVASAHNVVQYFILVASLGIPGYGVREIAKHRDYATEKNKVFSELFIIRVISAFSSWIIYLLLMNSVNWRGDFKLYLVVGISIISNAFNIDWYYQGEEKYKYIAIKGFIINLFSLIFLFALVHEESDYIYYAFVNVIAVVGNNLFDFFYLRNCNINLSVKDIHVGRHFKSIFILLCTSLSIELYTLLDTTMLTVLCSDAEVGYYTNALKIPRMIIAAVTGISGVLLPFLTRYYNENRIEECEGVISKIISVLAFFFIPAGIGLIIVAPRLMVVLFGESFRLGIPTLRITALLIYTLGFSNVFGIQILLTVDQEKKLLLCTIVGAFSNIIMNYFLIPILKQNGAAIASVISEMFVTIIAFELSNKYIRIKVRIKEILISLLSAGLMGLVCYYTDKFGGHDAVILVIDIIIGGCVYIIFNVVFKNPIILLLRTWHDKRIS